MFIICPIIVTFDKYMQKLFTEMNFFSIYDFLRRSRKKNKYRWFKVEGFGDG